ncbi:MAG: serine/threonine protein kinase [Myxococcales bacterium]|nr:serine/threonine protein kinase [Myxococcales bacterium]
MAQPEPARAPDPTLVLLSPGPPAAGSGSAPPGPEPGDDPRIGSVLKDTYHVLRKLGEGGMGAVYLAEHRSIRKKVAVKILGGEYSLRAELSERFLREARAAAVIESPNVIEIHDFGTTPDGAAFFVMEYLQGEDLGHLLHREGALPWPRVRGMLLQICGALQAAHDHGIVHRDMKPENCFRLERGDVVKVLDFGIAKVATDEADGGRSLTRTGMIFGTPEYMSPEQAQGAPHDHRVDIYATGVILFQLVTGQLPFSADNFMGLLNKHMFDAPPRPSSVNPSAHVPADLEAVILKALQKDPALRFQSMGEFAAAISAVGSGAEPVRVTAEASRPRPRAGEAVGFRDDAITPLSVAPTVATMAPRPAPARRSWIVPLVIAVLGAGVTAAVLLSGAGDEPAPVAAAPRHPELLPPDPPRPNPAILPLPGAPPEPAPQPPPDPPPVPKVSLQIRTGSVAASVLDVGGATLGATGTAITVPGGAEPIDLVLRADGYQDLRIRVTPDRDQIVEHRLQRKTAAKKGGPRPPPSTKKIPDNSDIMPLDR